MSPRTYIKVVAALLLGATQFACTELQPTMEVQETRVIAKTNRELISVGYASISAQKGATFDLQMLNAIKVSKIEAYKEMAEQLYGVLVSAENSVDGAHLNEDSTKSKVKGLVRGARVLRSYHEGDLYITELEVDLNNSPFFQ